MSNRIDLNPSATKSLGNQRLTRNIIAIIVVIITSAIFVIFSPRTNLTRAKLVGEGCNKTNQKDVKCVLNIGEKELVLRECSGENSCNQAEYKLSKRVDNKQYIAVTSEVFTKSIQILSVDIESMTQFDTDTAFYTEVKDSCKDKIDYTKDCFDFPVAEEQLKDIAEQNKKYNDLVKEYKSN